MDNKGAIDKTRIIIGTLAFLLYSHIVQMFIDKIGKGHYHTTSRLYDICHKYLPNYEKYEWIGNLYGLFVFLFILLKLSHSVLIVFELAAYIIPIYFVRSIFTLVTVLPKSSTCVFNPFTAFMNGGCHDKIFSGHIAMIFVLTLLLNKYSIISIPVLILLNFINVVIILLTRTHYTVDIIVSFLICYLMYTNNIRL